jgi:hypothetical protein
MEIWKGHEGNGGEMGGWGMDGDVDVPTQLVSQNTAATTVGEEKDENDETKVIPAQVVQEAAQASIGNVGDKEGEVKKEETLDTFHKSFPIVSNVPSTQGGHNDKTNISRTLQPLTSKQFTKCSNCTGFIPYVLEDLTDLCDQCERKQIGLSYRVTMNDLRNILIFINRETVELHKYYSEQRDEELWKLEEEMLSEQDEWREKLRTELEEEISREVLGDGWRARMKEQIKVEMEQSGELDVHINKRIQEDNTYLRMKFEKYLEDKATELIQETTNTDK